MHVGRKCTLAMVLLAAQGCAKHEKAPVPAPVHKAMKPAPPTPIAIKKVELGQDTWDPAWDKIVEEAIPASMLSGRVPRDVRHFCPRFYTMDAADKRAFWAYFFQALAGAEAGLNPTSRVRHTEPEVAVKDRVTGRMVRSQGLLQLTYEDQRRYGCDFDWKADRRLKPDSPERTILQPKNNLECGVKILERQIIDRHRPLVTRLSYWSTLHPGTSDYHMFAKQMTNPPAACGLHERRARRRSAAHHIAMK
ncbi:MAG TPA: hypothetical protein VFE38_06490 [Edaphobacter sp.]|nr:hypothetical protein [Edaphobacter sp.]